MRGDIADPDIRPLWQAVAARLAQGEDPARIQRVTVALSRAGHALVVGWLSAEERGPGRRSRLAYTGRPVAVPLPKVLTVLNLAPDRLPELLRQLLGEIPDLAAQRRHGVQLRGDLWAHAERVLGGVPRLLARLRAAGVVEERVAETVELVNALARARSFLPLRRPVPLPRLALHCAGKPHYFDLNDSGHGAKLVLLAADLLEVPLPETPAEDRAILARVGVIADRLSQTVLTANVEAVGGGPIDRVLRLARQDRRPVHLTLHDLTAWPPQFDPRQPWLVVENPSVVEEAHLRGAMSPIVCTSGTLTAVDHVILGLARDAGVPLVYNGDLDLAGHAIAAAVALRYAATVQHMGSDTQVAAEEAGCLMTRSEQVPSLAGPSTVALAPRGELLSDGPGETSDGEQRWVVYQEHPVLLDLVLGPDPNDPLGTVGSNSRVPRRHV